MKPDDGPIANGASGRSRPDATALPPAVPCPTANAGLDGRGVLLRGLAGAAAMFLVQPPADLWALAWLAPIPWLTIVRTERITAAHPWRTLWFAGLVHWLATIHWLRLPHPATAIGWVALSAYLACYVPLFVAIARRLVHGWGWPLAAAAAVAWMACEQIRGWLLGGFTFGGLGHTQWRWTTLIQLADCLGAVGVGGVVMAVSAGLTTAGAEILGGRLAGPRPRFRPAFAGLFTAAAVLGAALCYGRWREAEAPRPTGAGLDVLLVQGSIDTELKHDPAAAGDVVRHYDGLTAAALDESGEPPPALIAWPETMWRFSLLEIDPEEKLPETVVGQTLGAAPPGVAWDDPARQAACRRALEQERLAVLSAFARRYRSHWLVGIDKQVVTPRAPTGARHYNCGLFLDPEGAAVACYSKRHPVMFGEYVPLGSRFPWLYRLTPLPAGLTPGDEEVAVSIAGHRVAVNICYETALPEAVRSQVLTLARAGGTPDLIVNLTNDGWFWGSSELDMHLTAAVFRAVEVRTPILVAANTGFSAAIDGSGRLLARGPRRATGTLRVRAEPDGRRSPWLVWGSLPLGLCVAVATVALVPGWSRRSSLEKR